MPRLVLLNFPFSTVNFPFVRNRQLLAFCAIPEYDTHEVIEMTTKEIISKLRAEHDMTQEELANKVFVTRQAVSRWEAGETVPGVETLKLLSNLFDVSINTLLGSPRQLVCQCCGMPLDDSTLSREPDGSFNEDYCKWCYTDGGFVYTSLDQLTDFLVEHFASEQWPADQARAYYREQLPKLKHWAKTK